MNGQRRNRGLEIGVLLLLFEMFKYGLDKIPPVTLCTIIFQILLYIGIIRVPWNKWEVCISSESILKNYDYKRLFVSVVEHGDDMHLYYNMISFMMKGRSLERRYGGPNFAILLLILTFFTSMIYVGLGVVMANLLDDRSYMYSCAIGFSGVIFALKVLTSFETPSASEFVGGFYVPSRYAAWVELILIHLLVPNASFLGHLAGILAGVLYACTRVGRIIDANVETITGEPVIHEECYYNPRIY